MAKSDSRILLAAQGLDTTGGAQSLVNSIQNARLRADKLAQNKINNERLARLDLEALAQQDFNNQLKLQQEDRLLSQEQRLAEQANLTNQRTQQQIDAGELSMADSKRQFAANVANENLGQINALTAAGNYDAILNTLDSSEAQLNELGIDSQSDINPLKQAALKAKETGDDSELKTLVSTSLGNINKSKLAKYQFGNSYKIRGSEGEDIIVTERQNPNTGEIELIKQNLGGQLLDAQNLTPNEKQALNKEKKETEQEIKNRGEAIKLATKKAGDYFDKADKIKSGLGVYDEVIDAIDGGASTGTIANKFKTSIKDQTILLENAKNRLGLEVVGSVTFGALSEAELKLAMQTGLPTDLSGEELKDWVIRKKRAQEKALQAFEEAAIFLGDGTKTIADYTRHLRDSQVDYTKLTPEQRVSRLDSIRNKYKTGE